MVTETKQGVVLNKGKDASGTRKDAVPTNYRNGAGVMVLGRDMAVTFGETKRGGRSSTEGGPRACRAKNQRLRG